MALEGVEGRMFQPMAITVALALGGALLFSLTRSRRWRRYVLHRAQARARRRARASSAALRRALRRACSTALARPQPGAGAVAGAGALVRRRRRSARTLGAEFVPRLDEGELSLDIKRLPSISITEAQRLGVQVEEVLARFPEVRSVVTRTGRAEVATDPVGPDETEVMVKLRPKEEWTTAHDLDDLGEAIKQAIEGEVPATFVVGVAADRGPRQPAAGRLARRRRDQGVRRRPGDAQDDRRRDRQRSCATCPGAATGACSACSACRCSR